MPFLPGIDLVFRVEPFSLYFSALSAGDGPRRAEDDAKAAEEVPR